MWQRLRFYSADTGLISVPASSYVDWLTISGPGKAVRGKHKSQGTPADHAHQLAKIDGQPWLTDWGVAVSITSCYWAGVSSKGYYSFGDGSHVVTLWDTANAQFSVWGTLSNLQWLESLSLRLKNSSSSSDSHMQGMFFYYLPTASKSFKLEMIAPKMPKVEHLNEIRNEFKLHHIVIALSKQGKGKGAKNQYKLTINSPDSFRDKNLYKVVEKIQKAVK